MFLSHDDEDHTGNRAETVDLCPNATLVTRAHRPVIAGVSLGPALAGVTA